MSTPEIMMLLSILPKALRDHPEWFTVQDREAAERLMVELRGRP